MLTKFCGMALVAALVLGLAGPGTADIIVTDLDTDDLFVLNSTVVDSVTQTVTMGVTVAELTATLREPYPGYVLTTPEGGFFDLTFAFDQDALDAGSEWDFVFNVTNATDVRWMGYGFEFYDAAFTNRLADFPLTAYSTDVGFSESEVLEVDGTPGTLVWFYATDSGNPHHEIGQVGQYILTIDLSLVNGGDPGSFGIRQVAVAPEPASLGLLGLALLGLRRRRR